MADQVDKTSQNQQGNNTPIDRSFKPLPTDVTSGPPASDAQVALTAAASYINNAITRSVSNPGIVPTANDVGNQVRGAVEAAVEVAGSVVGVVAGMATGDLSRINREIVKLAQGAAAAVVGTLPVENLGKTGSGHGENKSPSAVGGAQQPVQGNQK
ncbi:MAG: hypothetical protein KGJ21_09990 [Pseudomonadota bacterium]|nr:hypothetical protein [Pseudomonadota bacterium]